MASTEVNKMLMRVVTDADFRTKFLDDPAAVAKDVSISEAGLYELSRLDMKRVREQFVHLSGVSADLLGSVVSAGHSSDHLDRSKIHDNDGHIHDKAQDSLTGRCEEVINPVTVATLNPAALANAVKDPAILREFETNPALRAALKAAVR